jgi:phage replication O-like protein O
MAKTVQETFHFQGFRSPRYTQVPDEVFDELLTHLSGAELKVLLYIIRRTFGFKKESDNISLNQLLHGITTTEGIVLDRGTGLTKKTLLETIKSLVEKKLIIAQRRRSEEKGNEPTTYHIHMIGEKKEKENTPLGIKSTPRGGVKNTPSPRGKKYTTQETVVQETVTNTVNGVVKGGEKSVLQQLPDLGEPPEKIEYVAKLILDSLGDERSARFYQLVAAKIPEGAIRETLSEVRADGARSPAKLFTYKIKQYALRQQKGGLVKTMGSHVPAG